MSGFGGITWLAGQHATLEEAVAVGAEVRAAAVAAGASLPKKALSRLYPATMQDAVSIVHARLEENKKKAQQSKQKSKSKGAPHSPSDSHFPGALQGGGDPSAFWMYIEDYFRDFTQEDLRSLMPLLLDPRDDPALTVPPSGRRLEDEQQQRKHAAAKAAAAEAAKAAAAAASSRGEWDWDGGAVDSKPSPGLDGLSPDTERRSSRLVSRHSKEEELKRQQELEAQALAAATAAEQAEAAAAAAAARAMAQVPTTASGAPAKQLLDVLPDQRLALLLQQLSELQELAGLEPFSAEGNAGVQAVLDGLQAAAAGSNGSRAELDAAARTELQDWLREQLAGLAERLGCSLPVLPPWAGQPQAAATADGSEPAAAGGAAAAEAAAGQPAAEAEASAAASKLATAAYLHPYTELMLQHPVQQHTIQQAVELPAPDMPLLGLTRQATATAPAAGADAAGAEGATAGAGGEAATPATSFMTATPGSVGGLAEVPSVANLAGLEEQQADEEDEEAAAAAGGGGELGDMASPGGAEGAAGEEGAVGADGLPLDGSSAGIARAGGRARAVSNYALLAGKKSANRAGGGPPKKTVRTTATAKQEADAAAAAHPVARAVAALVAAGEPDGAASEQWQASVEARPHLLAAAPEDEVLAEMLALQNELLQQAAINRTRLVPALAGVLAEAPERKAAAEARAVEEGEVKAWIQKVREIKRQQHRQRREEAHQEALAAKKQSIMASPRPVLGRQRGTYQMDMDDGSGGGGGSREGSPALEYALRPDELYDVLAQRDAAQEAFCSVCGDGHSEPPNEIVFCERCDVAVHQLCYGISVVPEGEWLCEPCRDYEESLQTQGVPPAEIRPRSVHEEHRPLEGGARSVKCALCPIKFGAFKRAEDGQRWVHSACALWMPETYMSLREVPGVGREEYVTGLDKVKPERLDSRCAICGLSDGAVMACQQPGGCTNAFHVLCARNIGLFLTIRPDPARKSAVQYRLYCALHSAAQQARDEKVWAERQEKAAAAQQKESKTKQAERLAAARQELAKQEADRTKLHYLRANLETCRMLIDVTKRRERLKKQLIVLEQQEWPLLLQQDPAAALALLQERHQRRRQTAQQDQEATAAAAAGEQPQPPEQGALPVAAGAAVAPPPPQQLEQFTLPLPQQQLLPASAMLGLPMGGPAGSLQMLPQQQQQLLLQQPQQLMMPPSMPTGAPSFALDMFGQQQPQHVPQQQQQQHMQQQLQLQQLQHQQMQYQHLQQMQQLQHPQLQHQQLPPQHFFMQQQQQQLQQQMGALAHPAGTSAAAAAGFPGLTVRLPPGVGPAPAALQHQQLLPGTAAAMFGPPGGTGMIPPSMQSLLQPPASAVQVAPGPSPRHPAPAAAAAAAAAGTPRGASPQVSGGVGRPKRAAASAQPASNKRRRVGFEDTPAATPRSASLAQQQPAAAAVAAAASGPQSAPQAAAGGPGGVGLGLASGRRQRTVTAKVRDNLLQRERQMTAEEAEALNARLPGPLRYLPAAELEEALGQGARASGGASSSGGGGQRQAKPRAKGGK